MKVVQDDEGVLRDEVVERLEKASKDVREGNFVPHEEVKKKLGL